MLFGEASPSQVKGKMYKEKYIIFPSSYLMKLVEFKMKDLISLSSM